MALNRTLRFIGFYRTAIFLPFVASAAATGILATYLFNPQFGLANTCCARWHLPQQGWLEDPYAGHGRHHAHVAVGAGGVHRP